MEVGVSSGKGRDGSAWPRNEVIVDDVRVALTIAISGNVSTTATPVVHDLQPTQLAYPADRDIA